MIGTQPPLTKVNLDEVFEEVRTYFEKRLPHISRRVEIQLIHCRGAAASCKRTVVTLGV